MASARTDLSLADEIAAAAERLDGNDRDFFTRVWSQDPEIYRERLRSIGFTGRRRVLDAGSGMGQWSRSLAELNESVVAVERSQARVDVSRQMLDAAGLENVTVELGSIERLPHPDAAFDAVFCYSVVYVTDYVQTLAELSRVLAPGGALYVSSNGLGWQLANLVTGHGSGYSDPRRAAMGSLLRTARYRLTGFHEPGAELITSSRRIRHVLDRCGFEWTRSAPDGRAGDLSRFSPKGFYEARRMGFENVFEVLGEKGGAGV